MSRKDQINIRVSDQGREILYALQDYYGLSQSGVLEMLLRDRSREVERDEGKPMAQLRKIGGAGRARPYRP